MKKTGLLLLGLMVAGVTQAKLSDFLPTLPEPKLKEHSAKTKQGYVGLGLTQKLLHVNAEWVNPYGIAYAKVGAFVNGDNEVGAQLGFRYPYFLTGTDLNGYYFGVYAGHLDNVSVDGKYYQRLGGGVDLAYVLLDRERISSFSVGVGAAEKVVGKHGSKKSTEPQLQFAYSLSFDVF